MREIGTSVLVIRDGSTEKHLVGADGFTRRKRLDRATPWHYPAGLIVAVCVTGGVSNYHASALAPERAGMESDPGPMNLTARRLSC